MIDLGNDSTSFVLVDWIFGWPFVPAERCGVEVSFWKAIREWWSAYATQTNDGIMRNGCGVVVSFWNARGASVEQDVPYPNGKSRGWDVVLNKDIWHGVASLGVRVQEFAMPKHQEVRKIGSEATEWVDAKSVLMRYTRSHWSSDVGGGDEELKWS